MANVGRNLGRVACCGVLLAGMSSILVANDSQVGTKVSPAKPQTAAPGRQTQRELWTKLDNPITFEFERGPLREATAYVQDRYALPIIVDTEAFKEQNQPDIESVETALPKTANLKLATVLRRLLKPIQADFQVDDGFIAIVPKERMDPLTQLSRQLDASFNQQPLQAALDDLALLTGFSIVLDARAGEKGKTAVTARFHQAGLGDAVHVLANMAGLESVLVGSVVYVTSKENARELRGSDQPRAGD